MQTPQICFLLQDCTPQGSGDSDTQGHTTGMGLGSGLGKRAETRIKKAPEDNQVVHGQSPVRWTDAAAARGLPKGPGHPWGACMIPGHGNRAEVDGAQPGPAPAEDRQVGHPQRGTR